MDLIELHDVPRRLLTLSLGGAPFYAAVSFLLTRSVYLLLGRLRYRPLKAVAIAAAILHIPGTILLLIELVGPAQAAYRMPDSYPITYLWIIPLVITSQAGLYGVPLVLLRLGFSLCRSQINVIRTTFRVLLVVLVIGTSLYVSGRVYYDLHQVEYATHRLHNNGTSDTLRIAVIADIQADAFTDIQRVKQYCRTAKELDPDVILFAGDLATIMYVGSIEPAANAYGDVLGEIPAYGVLGDHDYWTKPGMVAGMLRQNGLYIGRNELITLRASTTQLNVLLIENFALSRIPGNTLDSLLELPREGGLDVAVVHHLENRILERLKGADFDLVVTGHTHGGQIALDFYGLNVTAALLDIDRISGMNREYGIPIYTSNGLGMSTVPIRYNATPTIGLLEILP